MIASASWKWPSARAATASQTGPSPTLLSTALGSVADNPGLAQLLLRQIEAADLGVFVDIAENIGELQRAAEMMRQRHAILLAHAEHADRQPPHRARDAIAIKVELRPIRRADVLGGVHLHAVDHGEEILLAEPEVAHRLRQRAQFRRRTPGIDRLDPRAPFAKPKPALGVRRGRIRDVIDQPAERIDFEHRLALRARQDPHRGVERAAGGAARRAGANRFGIQRVWRRSSAGDPLTAPGVRPRRR